MAQLQEQIQSRYLQYAISVITSRALPDVRDGLKPVQRRILYAMWRDLRLKPGTKHRKSAAIVGATLGRYHPHGDQSVYDAMVRMAQDFSMRYPLVDPHGNFGSIDGDNAASMRYTSARLASLAERLLEEIEDQTVPFVDNYDGTTQEPSVLPAQLPNLLMNGVQGIAVGMATNIPPHNLTELCDALIALSENPDLTTEDLIDKHVKGPDLPSGAQIVEAKDDLVGLYQTGHGSFTMRAVWGLEDAPRKQQRLVITEIPYQVNKAKLFKTIAEAVVNDEIPQISEVRDESTDEVRLVFDLKKDADPETALAYLFKETDLETSFHVNMTCLVPNSEGRLIPQRLGLKELLLHFLEHRKVVTRRRLSCELEKLQKRIHILTAFETVLEDVDQLLEGIRASKNKGEARAWVENTYNLDKEQAVAVVSQALYKLTETSIDEILKELELRRSEADRLNKILKSDTLLVKLLREELTAVKGAYGDARKTRISEEESQSFEYTEEAYITSEDVFVILSRGGWVRSQKSYSEISALRCRETDSIGWVFAANTKDTVILFASTGSAYTLRVADLPHTTGYGDPIQTMFNFEDGEHIVGAYHCPYDETPDLEMISVSSDGRAVRFDLEDYQEPSTARGRMYHRPEDEAHVVAAHPWTEEDAWILLATRHGRGITFDPASTRYYKGAGKGLRVINLEDGDAVLGFCLCGPDNMVVETNRGAERNITADTYKKQKRGGKGYHIIKRGHLVKWHRPVVEAT